MADFVDMADRSAQLQLGIPGALAARRMAAPSIVSTVPLFWMYLRRRSFDPAAAYLIVVGTNVA